MENSVNQKEILDIKSSVFSLGGGISLAIVIVLTLIVILSWITPILLSSQLLIVSLLFFAGWFYFINIITERIVLKKDSLSFQRFFGHDHTIYLHDIEYFKFNDLKLTLNGYFYSFEIRTFSDSKIKELGLGPCWNRQEIILFVNLVNKILKDQKIDQDQILQEQVARLNIKNSNLESLFISSNEEESSPKDV